MDKQKRCSFCCSEEREFQFRLVFCKFSEFKGKNVSSENVLLYMSGNKCYTIMVFSVLLILFDI